MASVIPIRTNAPNDRHARRAGASGCARRRAVASIVPNGPAARAGLKSSDLIVAIDGQTVDDPNAFDYRFVTRPLGGAAQIDVQRVSGRAGSRHLAAGPEVIGHTGKMT